MPDPLDLGSGPLGGRFGEGGRQDPVDLGFWPLTGRTCWSGERPQDPLDLGYWPLVELFWGGEGQDPRSRKCRGGPRSKIQWIQGRGGTSSGPDGNSAPTYLVGFGAGAWTSKSTISVPGDA